MRKSKLRLWTFNNLLVHSFIQDFKEHEQTTLKFSILFLYLALRPVSRKSLLLLRREPLNIKSRKQKKKTEEEKRMGPIYERLTVATPTSRFAYVLFAYVLSLVHAQ